MNPIRTLPLLLATSLLAGCVDPPPGLLDALRFALMGQARGCPTQACPSSGVGSWSHSSTPAQVVNATLAVSRGYTPTWTARIGASIPQQSAGSITALEGVRLNVSGFGSVTVKSTDLSAEVIAQQGGHQAFLEHPSHDGGTGQCPQSWVSQVCRYVPEVRITTRGEIGASWVSGSETVSGSLSVSDSFNWRPGTEQSWCGWGFHLGVRAGWQSDGTPAPVLIDPAALAPLPAEQPDDQDTGEAALPCSSHADCPSDACAERWCDPSTATCQAAEAPDGTPCPDGTCEQGVCVD